MGMCSVLVKTKNNKLKMDAFRVGPVDMQSMFRVDPEKVKSFRCISRCFQVMNIFLCGAKQQNFYEVKFSKLLIVNVTKGRKFMNVTDTSILM
jgi:hypothetical protein